MRTVQDDDHRRKMREMLSLGSGRSWPELGTDSEGQFLPWIRQRRVVYSTPYQKIYAVTAEFGDFTKEYFVDEARTRAGLVVDRAGAILLVRQYRLLIDCVSWEVPGGAVDEGETPQQAAVRECLEETGVRCANPQPLLFLHMGLDTLYSPTHLFFSTDVVDEMDSDGVQTQEVSGREWMPLKRCIQMIFEGEIVDSFSIAALLAYHSSRNGRKP